MTDQDAGSLLDRLAAARQQRERDLVANRQPPQTAEARMELPYAPGDRVFDTLSGSHGRVARVDPAATGGVASVLVQLDAGAVVTRDPSTLIDRPSER